MFLLYFTLILRFITLTRVVASLARISHWFNVLTLVVSYVEVKTFHVGSVRFSVYEDWAEGLIEWSLGTCTLTRVPEIYYFTSTVCLYSWVALRLEHNFIFAFVFLLKRLVSKLLFVSPSSRYNFCRNESSSFWSLVLLDFTLISHFITLTRALVYLTRVSYWFGRELWHMKQKKFSRWHYSVLRLRGLGYRLVWVVAWELVLWYNFLRVMLFVCLL